MSKEIGQQLRQAREALGMTLADVARRTNIEIKYIIAIEKGEWNRLPNIIYARAYVKTYAKLVGESINITQISRRGSVANMHTQTPYTRRSQVMENTHDHPYYTKSRSNTRRLRQIQAEVIDKTDTEQEETDKNIESTSNRQKSKEIVTSKEEEIAYESLPSRREKEKASRRKKETTNSRFDMWYNRFLIVAGVLLIIGFSIFLFLKLTSTPGLPIA